MDGTLVDSSTALTNAINYVRAKLNLEPLDSSIVLEQINNPNCDLAKFFYNVNTIEPIHEQWFKEYYSANHDKELVLFDGVEQMLQELQKSNIKLAIATNAYRASTQEALKHLKIDRYFDDIICYDEVERGKPAPDMLHILLERNKEVPNSSIFVGDSDRDYLASKEAGIKFIRVAFANNNPTPDEVSQEIKRYFGMRN